MMSEPPADAAASPARFVIRVLAAWMVVSALLIAVSWSAIAAGRFPDPDDAMRLVQVRDLLAGQSWFDLTQYRSDAPGGGVAMHWSRVVDLPLVVMIAALTPLIGAAVAESAALIIVPLVTLLCVMLLAARIAWKLLGAEEATLTCLVLAIAIPVLFQLEPLRIDHHGWQIVCALGVANAMMLRSPGWGGAIIGAVCAVWLAISIEGLPLAAVVFAVLALRWLRPRDAHRWLVSAITVLALASPVLFALTRGLSDLATHCDTIGPAHLGVFVWGAVGLAALARLEPVPRAALIGGFALVAGGAVGLMLYAAPHCATGGFAELNPVAERYWLSQIKEGLPIWRQDLTTILQYAVTPVIGLAAAIRLALLARDGTRQFWSDYAIILGGALIVALLVSRAGAVACALAAPPLAWQLRRWLLAIRQMERPAPRLAAMLGVVCALLPAFPAMVLTSAIPAQASRAGVAATISKASACDVSKARAVLNALPQGEVFAPLDIGPAVLLETRHSVIATAHHRGHEGISSVIEIALAPPENARAMLARRGTRYVALCPGLSEARMYAQLEPGGLVAQLVAGDAPRWLKPVAHKDASGLKIWRISPE
jgi:hypothetical protein